MPPTSAKVPVLKAWSLWAKPSAAANQTREKKPERPIRAPTPVPPLPDTWRGAR